MFLKIGTTGLIISAGMLATVPVDAAPEPSGITPVLTAEWVDTSGVLHTTEVIDGVTTISAVVPFSVEFSAIGTVSTLEDSNTVAKGAHALGFHYHFGEETTETWATTGQPKVIQRGPPVAGYVFRETGTKQVVLKIRNSAGAQEQIRCNLVLSAPGAGTNMTSGVLPTFVSGGVYNAPAGGVWPDITSQLNGLHDIIIRKTGSGADPRFGEVSLDNRNEPNFPITRSSGIRFLNCDVARVKFGNVGFDGCAFVGGRVRALELYNMYSAAEQLIAQSRTAQQAQNVRMARGLFLHDTGEMNDSGGGYVVIGEMRGLHVNGAVMRKTSTAQHNTRGVFMNTTFSNCLITNSVAGSVGYFKGQGWECTNASTPDPWPDNGMVVAVDGDGLPTRILGLPIWTTYCTDVIFGDSGSDQPDANGGYSPENNNPEADQGAGWCSFDFCRTVWTSTWYTFDGSGQYIRSDYRLNMGAGAQVGTAMGVNHTNRVPPGWNGPYAEGPRPVVVP